jgi:hypothetical protein
MLRHAVTLWYVLAAVLTPKVCCCALRPTPDVQPQRTAAVTEVREKTCPHCRTTEKAPDDAKPADKPKCPCKEGQSHEPPAVVTAPASQWLAGPDAPTGSPCVWTFDRQSVLTTTTPFTSVPRTGPPLTSDDLLRAFHLLRC